ncbi:hypothetical protein SC81_23270, partial [Vibrio vulnificus]
VAGHRLGKRQGVASSRGGNQEVNAVNAHHFRVNSHRRERREKETWGWDVVGADKRKNAGGVEATFEQSA